MTTTHKPPPPPRRIGAELFELLGSMRFAVSLLVIICIASVVGTVLGQNQSQGTYIDRFGPFWYDVFDKFDIWQVYNSVWFLVIMGFLVVSTTICLIRNVPKMVRDMRSFREHVRAGSLRAFPQRVEQHIDAPAGAIELRMRQWLGRQGYAIRERREGDAVLLAARKGASNRLGYIFAHAAIVVICVGGLLDSELPVRLQIWLGDKKPVVDNMLIREVPESGRLSLNNPSFRANMMLPEGSITQSAIILAREGALVQPLPFSLRLDEFVVDYYSNGMPSRFASKVEVIDWETGDRFDQVIEVNEPLRYKGVTVYQSSFEDGGSSVRLMRYPLRGGQAEGTLVSGVVGESQDLQGNGQAALRLDLSALRPINVEDLTTGQPQPKELGEHVAAVTGSAAGQSNSNLRNVGPSIEYQLIDAAGQAHQFHSYMAPIELEGFPVFLFGARPSPAEDFRYLQLPADENLSLDEFMALRASLNQPELRREAAARFTRENSPAGGPNAEALQNSAERALETFSNGGLQAVAQFIDGNVPEAERERAASIVVRLIGASLESLRDINRERMGLAALPQQGDEALQAQIWTRLAVAALSDLAFYPADSVLTLVDFEQRKASVFQVTRSPGKNIVYLGCLFLVIGVFAMFYIRDRRIWIWLKPEPGADGPAASTSLLAAMTSQKRTLDFLREFSQFRQMLERMAPAADDQTQQAAPAAPSPTEKTS